MNYICVNEILIHLCIRLDGAYLDVILQRAGKELRPGTHQPSTSCQALLTNEQTEIGTQTLTCIVDEDVYGARLLDNVSYACVHAVLGAYIACGCADAVF